MSELRLTAPFGPERSEIPAACGEDDDECIDGELASDDPASQCAYGSFRRDLLLPQPVIGDRATATYRDGGLRVDLPRRSPSQGRCIGGMAPEAGGPQA